MGFKLDKIYTRTGDKGFTHLIGGSKVSKADLQVECYGTMDELNANLGVIRTFALAYKDKFPAVAAYSEEVFKVIQNDLFDMGSVLATARNTSSEKDAVKKMISNYASDKTLTDVRSTYLEQQIDKLNENLNPIPSFTLPGGGNLNAFAHVGRTVCRRLERVMVRWGLEDAQDYLILAYVNRLSDFLFVYSRWVSQELGEPEFLWQTPLK